MSYLKVILLLLFLAPFYLTAQDQAVIDSLTNELSGKSDKEKSYIYAKLRAKYYNRDIKKSKEYLDLEILHANLSKDKLAILSSKTHLSNFYYATSNLDSAKVILNELFEEPMLVEDSIKYAKLLHLMSAINAEQGDFDKAIKNELESIRIKEEKGGRPLDLADGYYFVGNIEGYLRNYEKSNGYYEKARAIYKKEGDSEFEMNMVMLMGLNDMETGYVEKARTAFLTSTDYYRENNLPNDLARGLSHLGTAELLLDNIELAINYYNEGLDIANANGDFGVSAELTQRLSDVHSQKGDYKKSIEYLNQTIEPYMAKGDKESLSRTYKLLSLNYKNLKQYDKAFDFLELHIELQDSILGLEKQNAINALEIEYETEKKEQEIEMLQIKDENNQLQKRGLLIGLLSFIGIAGLFLYSLRQRLKNVKIAKEKAQQELEFNQKELDLKKQELMAFALQLAHKNEVLETIKLDLNNYKAETENKKTIQSVVNNIDINQNDDNVWEEFRKKFLLVHKGFEDKILNQFTDLTKSELKLCSLLKMNLSSKEIANILNISSEGIKKARYRLRKKLNLESNESLQEFILKY